MKIYISGQITGLEVTEAFERFERAEKHLESLGFDPVNPMKKTSVAENKTWKEYMLEDIELLWDCDVIYMLDNYEDSRGAKVEMAIAEALDIKIHFQINA